MVKSFESLMPYGVIQAGWVKIQLDDGMFGCGIFINLQKAFDTVNHSILLNNRALWYKRYNTELIHKLFNRQKSICFWEMEFLKAQYLDHCYS